MGFNESEDNKSESEPVVEEATGEKDGQKVKKVGLARPAFVIVALTLLLVLNQAGFFGNRIKSRFSEVTEGFHTAFFGSRQTRRQKHIVETVKKIVPLQEKLTTPTKGEWLATNREPGQTFAQYTRANPVKISKKRKYLYVQPIGKFEGKQKEVLEKSCEYLGLYFGCEIKKLPKTSSEDYPVEAVRRNPYAGQKQLLTTHILYKVLRPKLPKDAIALIAFTDVDLWPGRNWNFVFGQAALKQRVGVWSLARHGDPEKQFEKCLVRSIKVATHETGHMFTMNHCIFYRCNMQGSNSLTESDSQPSTLCPHCLAKVIYATKVDPIKRYRKLEKFCEQNKLKDLQQRFEKHRELLESE